MVFELQRTPPNSSPKMAFSASNSVVSMEGVSLEYTEEQIIFRDINMHLSLGDFYFLLGPSGSGKTSLIKLLGLLQPPTHGILQAFGYNPYNGDILAHNVVKRMIGIVPSEPVYCPSISVAQNIALPLIAMSEKNNIIADKVIDILEWLELQQYADTLTSNVSLCIKKKMMLARAMIHRPSLLFLDNLTDGMDDKSVKQVMRALEEIRSVGICIVFATNNIQLLTQYAALAYSEIHIYNKTLQIYHR